MTTVARPPGTATRPSGALSFEGTAGWQGTGTAAQIGVLTARLMRTLVLDRRVLAVGVLEPLVMLVAFGQVFAGLAHSPGFPPGVRYLDFLLPALLLTTALQSGVQAGMGIVDDTRTGLLTRLRSMPVRPGSILAAHGLACLVRGALRLFLLLVLAWSLFGHRPPGGPAGVLAAAVLCLVIGWSLGWVFLALACWIDRVELLQATTGLVMFPLMFASNAFVPVGALPTWLEWIARLNPVTYGVDAARDLCLTGATGPGALAAAGIGLAIAVSAAPVAVRGLARSR
ncbi:ABC-2 type transport system permease protein [Thermomonospora echinospora]|uniref:Transport permease protein n=1 Tax=Thermomonospora echinospora TaxID=1992 RepID=A0A1H6DJI3_9ACTN|nr:ABC transporter permease [Thermomonospora echinospora]SEG85557.1 ABC-2 type transport system permease protein [Thermomonospora echinospora]